MLAKFLSWLLATLLLMTVCAAEAQQSERIYRIGYLAARNHPTPTAPDSNLDSFRDGMRDLGYVIGKNLVIEPRFADGNNATLSSSCYSARSAQRRCDCFDCNSTESCRKRGDVHNPSGFCRSRRSGCVGSRKKPRPPRRQRDGSNKFFARAEWKKSGVAQRGNSANLSDRCSPRLAPAAAIVQRN